MNKFSIYQYALILLVLVLGSIYALPNLYPTQPSIQVAYTDSAKSADQILLNDVEEILEKSEAISVIDHRKDEGYVTPVEIAGEDKVYISRIRNDETLDNGISLWVVSDNLRKGAALNAVQIAELIISQYSNFIEI